MEILQMTRKEIIDDLPVVYRTQNDLEAMSDKKLIAAWKRYGFHTGTWDWDDVDLQE